MEQGPTPKEKADSLGLWFNSHYAPSFCLEGELLLLLSRKKNERRIGAIEIGLGVKFVNHLYLLLEHFVSHYDFV